MKETLNLSVKILPRDATENTQEIKVSLGANLRKALLAANLTPYRGSKTVFNCRGMGICGTCKILVRENGEWWERRSCQIQCFQSLEIQLK